MENQLTNEAATNRPSAEERIDILEQQLSELRNTVADSWSVFQNLFGVKFIRQDKMVSLQIVVSKKEQGNPGLLSDMYQKLTRLWNKYGGDIIVVRR